MSAPDFLIIDDDERFREKLRQSLERRGHRVVTASDSQSAISASTQHQPEKIILDLRLGIESGLALVPDLVASAPDSKVVVLTGYGSIATALEAVRRGAWHYLTKPASVEEILSAFSQQPPDSKAAQPVEKQVPSLSQVEWEHIQRVVTDHNGNISRAAQALGIHRRSLQRKLSKLP